MTPEKIAEMDKITGLSSSGIQQNNAQKRISELNAIPSVINQSPFIQKSDVGIEKYKQIPVIGGAAAGLANIGKAITTSEQNFGQDIGQAAYLGLFGGQKKIDAITKQYMDNGTTLTELAKKQTDPELKKKYAQMAIENYTQAQGVGKSIIGDVRTPAQIVGDAIGVGANILLAGTYGKATAGMESFKLGQKAIAPVVQEAVKRTTGQVVKGIVKETSKQALKGGAIGYGMDVNQNLQAGKEDGDAFKPGLGTVIGVAAPVVIGGMQVTKELLKNPDNAGRVVNSLIKPLQKDFAYGKDPGKAIAESGITANSLDELGQKVRDAKIASGQELGQITSSIEGKATVDLSRLTDPIDKAIEQAQKAPETNKALITRLEGLKSDLLNYVGDGKNLTFVEGIDAKGLVGDITKWTGNPSDDKITNKALKQVYGIINGEVMGKVKSVSPELYDQVSNLNDKYGNMIAADNAITHRNMILQRQNLISMPIKVGSAAGLITAVATGGATIPALLAGVGVGTLDKAMQSTAFKTRIASWLANESPTVIDKLYKANPAIRNSLIKLNSSR